MNRFAPSVAICFLCLVIMAVAEISTTGSSVTTASGSSTTSGSTTGSGSSSTSNRRERQVQTHPHDDHDDDDDDHDDHDDHDDRRPQRQAAPAKRARQAAKPTTLAVEEEPEDASGAPGAPGAPADEPEARGAHNSQFAGPRRPTGGNAGRPAPIPVRPPPPPHKGSEQPQTLTLPDGVDIIIGQVQPGFNCDGRQYGYYADTFNDCRLFHVCVPIPDESGAPSASQPPIQWSFICGNATRFNQELLICDHEDNVDCSQAESFYSVNDNFGRPEDKVQGPPPAQGPAPKPARG